MCDNQLLEKSRARFQFVFRVKSVILTAIGGPNANRLSSWRPAGECESCGSGLRSLIGRLILGDRFWVVRGASPRGPAPWWRVAR
jgi:hypothetical protein